MMLKKIMLTLIMFAVITFFNTKSTKCYPNEIESIVKGCGIRNALALDVENRYYFCRYFRVIEKELIENNPLTYKQGSESIYSIKETLFENSNGHAHLYHVVNCISMNFGLEDISENEPISLEARLTLIAIVSCINKEIEEFSLEFSI